MPKFCISGFKIWHSDQLSRHFMQLFTVTPGCGISTCFQFFIHSYPAFHLYIKHASEKVSLNN